jgi:hypothetical protein
VIFSANWGLVLVMSLSKMSIASPLPCTVRMESQNVLIPIAPSGMCSVPPSFSRPPYLSVSNKQCPGGGGEMLFNGAHVVVAIRLLGGSRRRLTGTKVGAVQPRSASALTRVA